MRGGCLGRDFRILKDGRRQFALPVLLVVENVHYDYEFPAFVDRKKDEMARVFHVVPAKSVFRVDHAASVRPLRYVVGRFSYFFHIF
jgi:hypothetical protein